MANAFESRLDKFWSNHTMKYNPNIDIQVNSDIQFNPDIDAQFNPHFNPFIKIGDGSTCMAAATDQQTGEERNTQQCLVGPFSVWGFNGICKRFNIRD